MRVYVYYIPRQYKKTYFNVYYWNKFWNSKIVQNKKKHYKKTYIIIH